MKALKFLVLSLLLIISIVTVFTVKHNVSNLYSKLSKINDEIYDIQNTIQVLEAEWSYITQPAKLEKLAKKYLNLHPVLYSQVRSDFDTEYIALASVD